jgi:PKD repeat protein
MKRTLLYVLTVMALLAMSLPAGTPAVMAQGGGNQTATNTTYPELPDIPGLFADFDFLVPECPLCDGVEFTDKSTGGTKPYEYHWDFGDGNTSTDENPGHFYDAYGFYDVTLTVTDDAGDVASTSKTVPVNEPDTETQTPPDDPGQDDSSGESGTVSGNQTDTGTPALSSNSTPEANSEPGGDSPEVSGKKTETDDTSGQMLNADEGESEAPDSLPGARITRGRSSVGVTGQGAGDETATDSTAIESSVLADGASDYTFAPTTTHNVTPIEKSFPGDRGCSDGGTLIKDQFKDLLAGTHEKTYDIDGQSVTVTITAYTNHTFDFQIIGGTMARLFVKSSGYLLYQYDPPVAGATNTGRSRPTRRCTVTLTRAGSSGDKPPRLLHHPAYPDWRPHQTHSSIRHQRRGRRPRLHCHRRDL